MEKLILIDGNSLINRAFYALPPLINKEGVYSQAVYGFATMLIRLIGDYKPNYIAVAFDLPGGTFRNKMYSEYKAGRKKMPDELAVQLPLLKTMLEKMNISIVEKSGFEADDVIGTLAKRNKVMTYIVTGDRDSLQLIDDTTTVLLTKRGITDMATMTSESLMSEMGITPQQIIEYKSLAGDSSDNIPGVAGVGDKTAITLLKEYGDLAGIYDNLDNMKGKLREKLISGKDMAYLSHELATIDTNVELDSPLSGMGYDFPFGENVKEYFEFMEFSSLLRRSEIFESKETAVVRPSLAPQVVLIKSCDQLKGILSQLDDKIAISVSSSLNFAFNLNTEYVINLKYSLLDNGLDYTEALGYFEPIFASDKIRKILFDVKDYKKTLKCDINNYFDVRLAQYLIDMTKNDTISEVLSYYGVDETTSGVGLLYLEDTLTNKLNELGMHELYFDIELRLIDVLYGMEKRGFAVDKSVLSDLSLKYTAILSDLTKNIYDMAGAVFNINSPKQLAKVLFEDLGIPYPKKGNSFSTGAEILEQVLEFHPIVALVLRYRFVSKLNSTYVDGLSKMIENGRIHTEFKQMLTTTGRLSSVEPNLQNIPVREEEGKNLRKAFVASGDNMLVTADYSQIELRLMAHFSQDETMIETYKKGIDIHTRTASEVFGVDMLGVTDKMRRDAKAVNFGIIYGISDFGLAQNIKISRYEARQYIERYFERFPKVNEYMKKCVELAKKDGYATTVTGRKRKIPELFSPNFNVRKFGERASMNMPLQGSAADIIKIAMIRVNERLTEMKSKLILQVHDELIVEASADEVEEVKRILAECMENVVDLLVPLTVAISVGKNWLECK